MADAVGTTAEIHDLPATLAIEPGAHSRLGRLGGGWPRFVAERVLGLALVLIVLSLATFSMVRLLPGDPAVYIASAGGAEATQDQIEAVRKETGLDKPFLTQFGSYFGGVITGDFGQSFTREEPVSAMIGRSIGPSLRLTLVTIGLIILVSIVGGMLLAHLTKENRRPRLEVGFTATTSVVGAIPDFFLATVLVFVFAVSLGWLPAAGDDGVSTLVLPALALAIPPSAILMRIVRVETLNVLAQEYVRTARSKRLHEVRVYFRHLLPNVLTAALTIAGLIFASVIGGAVVIETLFARPGLGSTLVDAVHGRDYPVIQASVIVLGLVVVLINAIVDILLAIADPRMRASQYGN